MGWVVLTVIIVLVVALIFYEPPDDKTEVHPAEINNEPLPPPDYKKKSEVMNTSEKTLYTTLVRELGGKFIVLSKVRIEDFININKLDASWSEKQGLRGKIKSRHVDFLLCDFETTEPLLAIELDGNSHYRYDRMQRDKFIADLYKEAGLPLKRISVGSDFDREVAEVKNYLLPNSATVPLEV